MTAVAADRILSAAQAFAVAQRLAAGFAPGAADRDRERALPYAEVDRLAASGLLAITVPAAHGGADLPPSAVAEVTRILATADPNIAQIPHSHFVYVNLLRLAGTAQQQERYFGRVLDGGRIANAQSERGGATVADIATTLRPVGDRFRVDGVKYYCTGSLFADLFAVLTRLDDPEGRGGLEPGEYIVYLPADTPGVRVVDDWNGIGQRTTGSGTVSFDGVLVDRDQVIPRSGAVRAPTGYGAFAQLLHAAIDTGIARGALTAATEFVRTKSRPWFEAGVANAVDDPLLIQRFGELSVAVTAAEATLSSAGWTLDAAIRIDQSAANVAQASLAVATAKVLADRAANDVSAALFEVAGTRSAAADLNLHHFWRNARTHTLHDPVRWKYQHIGRALLHDAAPPLHGVI
ncbi:MULTISPECIES: SfnB family sulfur acquisition oxidoreductase [Nocardia]|uniref:SfnB family sulfur acquisition oxidoreductase n=1 Tax=Nocardia implantans TaxID=3108168 RepID=A0ABU6AMV9_9NOCA|nr:MULTISPECIES: SfnB family sulfur acquisition oxidoreductase [unclassified Nocardia]MBF6193469.1 SfnB family sulfur acquisition oxidoreductase [Nocardia beijingensis]MEA3532619.1 SfnB family sulfur acquisition oxidoreductase [Nocardia sp. CDC192]MEB3508569.1 SfnB family sulfur acquisition oxidoreductase [Nocardia sp. CDC186]